MKFVTKYIEVAARFENEKDYIVTFPDNSELTIPRGTFELLFRPAQNDETKKFNESLSAGRIDLKTPVPARTKPTTKLP